MNTSMDTASRTSWRQAWSARLQRVAAAQRRNLFRAFHRWRTRNAPEYRAPTAAELAQIERELRGLGVACEDYVVDPAAFAAFVDGAGFDPAYHGGIAGGVHAEKLLEHYVAWELLGLRDGPAAPYVDIAACGSPWARLLRERGIEAHAIDLRVPAAYAGLPYYRQADATRSGFDAGSIGSASLQCAFEMFAGDDDVGLLRELGRILRPGGRVVVSPLYMHTHACYYQTPEHYGRHRGDPGATAYLRRDTWGVPASRKYSPATLVSRVLAGLPAQGLTARVLALRNGAALGQGIYLHFILVLDKPAVPGKGVAP
jgi:hypothetical protein